MLVYVRAFNGSKGAISILNCNIFDSFILGFLKVMPTANHTMRKEVNL